MAADVFNARKAQASLVIKTDFYAKLLTLNRKIIANKTKHLPVENEFKKLKTFDSIWFDKNVWFILEAKVTLKKMAHKIV